jgi:putative copper export protein
MRFVFYLHLLGAAIWVGGLITLGVTVSAVRSVTDDRAVLGAIARRFAALSWAAMAVLVVTGLIQAGDYGWSGLLLVKVSLVLASIILTIWHSLGAHSQLPARRVMIQATILILALVILALAVAL